MLSSVVQSRLACTTVAGLVNANPGGSRLSRNVRDDRKWMLYVVKRSGHDFLNACI